MLGIVKFNSKILVVNLDKDFENNFHNKVSLNIDKDNFIEAVILDKSVTDFDEFLNSNLNNISKITYKEYYDDDNWIYLKNSLVHHAEFSAWSDEELEIDFYYFKGILYSYDDWKELPERIREIREEKLELL
jgi:hypothetical protein